MDKSDILEERLNNYMEHEHAERQRMCREMEKLTESVAANTRRMEQAIMGLHVFIWVGSATATIIGLAVSIWQGWVG